jgi:hypothetical protein
LGTEELKLSSNDIVMALRSNATKQQFIAKVKYTNNGMDKEEKMIIDNDWIVDIYGYKVISKLMNQGSNHDFVLCPKTKKGTPAMGHLNREKGSKD